MIAGCGTFDYVAMIPEGGISVSFRAQLRQPIKLSGNKLADFRLVGHAPEVRITDLARPPNPGPSNPATSRSRVTLRALDREYAQDSEASFVLDRGLISALRPGDLLAMSRTGCGGVGVSAIRDSQLVFAVGVITAVPLGNDFVARFPYELVREAEAVFRKHDSTFEFVEYPLEIRAAGKTLIIYGGRVKVGDFELWIRHGYRKGIPGTDESVSIARAGACSIVDANSSVLFLEGEGLSMVKW